MLLDRLLRQHRWCVMRIKSHKCRIVETLLREGKKTATDFSFVSNANQYFVDLERVGIIKSEYGMKGRAKVKYRSIADEEKASDYLQNCKKKQPRRIVPKLDKKDEVQESSH